uniref:Uncharacterized protein n=1 Tax=Odontella aurita TaxID=265563 RepID=A0A6U6IU02_9STRA|mmetsp:Transcript_51595/g.154903  ORF Transcript_51595/g.154903 Transcript_51595/m.154903 type:complete len:137 (+) Transcript_51595:265-675(+)|eukprot:CAMPEP_0113526034 /NCGR_PEP_ID=MMETSP0015_2-20120614/513_1 /TAXON_ID=2838 /ORGANISM="Odontella" /LENGTH=136 /DNA_ID=CAMNT_0000424307 /DNA_START=265 /DNA_END=675 /DNA_ORIENTATION=+ /assembly_acc=CAM_ASM_000160
MSGNEDGRETVEEDYGVPPKAEPWTVGKVFGIVKSASERIGSSVKDFDEKTQLSVKTKAAAEATGKSLQGFNEQHQVTTKTKAAASAAGSSIKDFDEKHQVSTKTKAGLMSSVQYVSERFGSGKGGSGGGSADDGY